MSKKKAASTMSLKDFHGGSIPSDLPLPSAPGLTVKDRNASTNWSSNSMRPDLRPRPKSSGAARGFDEKASFLSHLAPIGRNFDEDERKPLDALSAPRRTINDENVRAVHQPGYVSSIRVPDRPVSSPVPQSPLSPLRAGRGSVVVSSQTAGGWGVSSNPPNAWGVRRDVAGAIEVRGSAVSSVSNTVTKFAQASALEKVSSGLWQSKNPVDLLPHVIYSQESGASHTVDVGRERGDYDTAMGSQAESGWVTGDRNQGGGKTLRNYGRDQSRMHSEEVPTGGAVGSQTRPVMPPEVSDRPKLNLLSKTKPLVRPENDYRQGHRQPIVYGKIEVAHELYGNENSSKPGLVNAKSGSQSAERPVERPKLNLKPRTQPLEKSDGILEIERSTLFGNARPRELVLKERGVDDLAFNKLDLNHSPNRMNSPKIETKSEHVAPTAHQSQKNENRGAINGRNGRDSERKDQRSNHEKTDLERKNWRNDKWKSRKDSEEQRPEPETWRKPIEESKLASSDAAGNRPGKILSALELAQAFSKSASNPKTRNIPSSQRGMPGRNDQPFSRLTDTRVHYPAPITRHRINGY
ncbi:EUKARYOTIC TRANSLATION INITIATION FACTOR 4B [Salix purpurea]|uniref:EUKARYOTIC TRANSLATION INITIATION FACTOR 4B n=1 Tax=Salix purpurea TaxID=77065 RepID=A0A9Q0UQT6_SALPP|nr:EUKARYOTIC TRANSLATION INITIATION FACTOR 4B [Salix purpurea]